MSDASFLAWCQQHGITTHGVQPGYVAEGWRGVIATQDIPPGSIVMSVPQQLLMSVMSARRDPQLASVLHHHQLNSHQVLAIHLLHEASKSSSSLWCAYIRQLPVTYTTFMCWPAEAVHALQLQHAQDAAIAAADKSRREWMEARPALQQLGLAKKWCSLGAWHWASSCVLSRTMYHPDDPPCGCLTPLADLHNHASPPPPYTTDLVGGVQQLLGRAVQQNTHPSAGEVSACAFQSGGASERCGSAALAAAVVLKMTAYAAAAEQCAAACATETSAAAPAAAGPANSAATAATDIAVNSSHVTAAGSADADGAVDNGLAAADAVRDSHDCSTNCPAACCGEWQGHEGGHAPCTTAAVTAHITPSDSSSVDGAANTARNSDSQDMLGGDGHYDATTKTYNIVARCSYSPGDQVFLCYGRHCNLDLLELYGFLIPNNPHEKAHLSVGIVEQALHEVQQQQQQQQQQGERQWRRRHQQQQQQRSVAVGAGLDVAAADCYIHNTGQPSWQLLKALRLTAASPAECRTLSHLAFSGEAMSVSSERIALLALMQACALQLQQLPTTLEQDQALISSMTEAAVTTQGTSAAVAGQDAPSAAPAAAADSSRDTSDNCSGVSSTAEKPVVPAIDHDRPQQQQTDQQQSASRSFSSAAEQQQQCIVLSMHWRACYKRALVECIGQCRKSVSTLEGE